MTDRECVGCDGNPAPENNPCAVCGRAALDMPSGDVERVAIPRGVVEFLLGEKPLKGVWFGDKHPDGSGPFWWRKYLRAAIENGEHLKG